MIGSSQDLFNRDLKLQVGSKGLPMQLQTLDPTNKTLEPMLRVIFSVERSLNKDPNTATVTVYNLDETNRRVLQEGANLIPRSPKGDIVAAGYEWPLVIEGGYIATLQMLFSGDIVYAESGYDGIDWTTKIEATDGGKQYSSPRFNKTFGKGTPVATVISEVAKAMKIGVGNSALKLANSAVFRKRFSTFTRSVTVAGRASEILNRYIKSIGYNWSIQDGQLQVLGLEDTLLDAAVTLTPDTGLIASPEQGEKGMITGTSLLQGDIKPGRRLNILSKTVNGQYRVEKATHAGDTWGNEWYTHFEGTPLF